MTPLIRTTQSEDVLKISKNLRGISVKEVERIGIDATRTIEIAVKKARYSWVGYLDNDIVCMWGLDAATIISNSAMLWLITTPLVEEHPFYFVRRSKIFIEELMKQEYNEIYGYVDHEFKRSLSWLRWLGFTVGRPGADGPISICKFWMER